MLGLKEKRPYGLLRDFRVLEREQRVTKILGSHAFRAELEGILQSQLDGSRSPPKLSRALSNLQENVVPASRVEAARRTAVTGPSSSGSSGAVLLPINDLRGVRSSRYALAERQLRCKLASLCRLVDWFQWSQLVRNHVSARGVGDGEEFLINPYGLLYCEVTASSLVRVNNEGVLLNPGSTQLGVNRAGVELHSAIYGARRDAKCIMHLHTVAGAAVSVMSCGLLPISEEAISLGKVSYWQADGRRSLSGEKERREFSKALGKNKALILRNHGLLAVGVCVEECFHVMYNLVQACQIQVAAAAAGLTNLMQAPPLQGVCGGGRGEESAGGGKVWPVRGQMEFEALMRMLDNQGYQTGYRYCGLGLLQPGEEEEEEGRGWAAWEEVVVQGGESANRQHRRRAREMRAAAKQKSKTEIWSFLDDNRLRDLPLTKNTKIRVRESGAVAVASARESESRAPWEFLNSTCTAAAESKAGSRPSSRPSTGEREASQQYTNTSGGSSATTECDLADTGTPSQPHHHRSRRRARRRRANHMNHSSPTRSATTPDETTSTLHGKIWYDLPGRASATTANFPALDLTTLEETAERVAHSTGVAVQKLSLSIAEEDGPKRTLSEPNLNTSAASRDDDRPSQPIPLTRLLNSHRLKRDSWGYSSGDEASPMGSPHKPAHAGTREQSADPTHTTDLLQTHNYYPSTITSPSHHTPTSHTTPITHSPADISYPNGYSSAEKAAYVARLVADSTGSAVQKLSVTMTERRQQLSLSDREESQPSPHTLPPTNPHATNTVL